MVFILPGNHVPEHSDRYAQWGKQDAEREESEMEARMIASKRLGDFRISDHEGEEEEDEPDLQNREDEHLERVLLLEVPDLMRKDRDNLFGRIVLHEQVVQHDPLLRSQSGEIGIRLRGPLRTVDHQDILEIESGFPGEILDRPFQFPLLKRGLLVEKGDDEIRIEHGHENREGAYEDPSGDPEPRSKLRVGPDEQASEPSSDDGGQRQLLDRVPDEDSRSHLVEAVSLLDDECAIPRERLPDKEGDEVDASEECESDEYGILQIASDPSIEPTVSEEVEERQIDSEGCEA